MNILDYIDWRGDITFEHSAFNEVDNLIFSTLAYLDMENLVSDTGDQMPTIGELYHLYTQAGYDQSTMINDPQPLLAKAAQSMRFKDIVVNRYVNKIDAEQQIQFAAVTFILSDCLAYVAFRGTDNTIVGWREDCNMCFLSETPGQNESVAYLNRIAENTKGDLIVGGHSKGGNFAVYASAFCEESVKENRIVKVYSNDGPGFNDKIAASQKYLSVLGKTEKIIPDSSLVGILLTSKEECKVIKSDAKGIMQHDPYSWCVLGASFEIADERSGSSLFMDDTLSRWVASMSAENKQILVNSVFDAIEASGATTLGEISEKKWASYTAILKAVAKIDSDSKSDLVQTLKKLLLSGKDAVKSETQRSSELKNNESN